MEDLPAKKKPRGRPPEKGEVRNPHGRPKKGHTITDLLNEYLESTTFGENQITGKQVLVQKVFQLAVQGDLAALKYCIDRIDGTPIQAIRQVDQDGNDQITGITVRFVDPPK
jgi:hypothetical protein